MISISAPVDGREETDDDDEEEAEDTDEEADERKAGATNNWWPLVDEAIDELPDGPDEDVWTVELMPSGALLEGLDAIGLLPLDLTGTWIYERLTWRWEWSDLCRNHTDRTRRQSSDSNDRKKVWSTVEELGRKPNMVQKIWIWRIWISNWLIGLKSVYRL
jgi:hypothetical protein